MSNIDFMTEKERQYPGYKVKGSAEKLAELQRLDEKRKAWIERYNREKASGKISDEVMDGLSLATENYNKLKEALTSGTAFTDQSVENLAYIPGSLGFSLGDINGRVIIDKNRVHVPSDNYNNTVCAEIVAEGGEATPKMLTDGLTVLNTEDEDAIIFDDILTVGAGTYSDDRKTLDQAINHSHVIHFINAENKKAFELMLGAKDGISLTAENLNEAINTNLCGKAKRNAVIIVNKSGFAELDIDVNGVSLVTKNADGEMVYKNKYVIKEIDDDILPNTDAGTPCIIGDMSIVKFFITRDDSLVNDTFGYYQIADRNIKKEIIKLSTTSDEAYIHGVLA